MRSDFALKEASALVEIASDRAALICGAQQIWQERYSHERSDSAGKPSN